MKDKLIAIIDDLATELGTGTMEIIECLEGRFLDEEECGKLNRHFEEVSEE